jgi:hypothetical protein
MQGTIGVPVGWPDIAGEGSAVMLLLSGEDEAVMVEVSQTSANLTHSA